MALVADRTRRCLEGGRRAVEVEAWSSPGGCLAVVAAGGVVAVVVTVRHQAADIALQTQPYSVPLHVSDIRQQTSLIKHSRTVWPLHVSDIRQQTSLIKHSRTGAAPDREAEP